ncbi:hypothetical protein U1Q18_050959, partial [Sarracenia purpurea var. burkii]
THPTIPDPKPLRIKVHSQMVNPFIYGSCTFHFHHQSKEQDEEEEEDEEKQENEPSISSSTHRKSRKRKRSRSNESSKNPFARVGRDKFSKLLTELEDKKREIYAQMGSDHDDAYLVRFVFSNANKFQPIVVRA